MFFDIFTNIPGNKDLDEKANTFMRLYPLKMLHCSSLSVITHFGG